MSLLFRTTLTQLAQLIQIPGRQHNFLCPAPFLDLALAVNCIAVRHRPLGVDQLYGFNLIRMARARSSKVAFQTDFENMGQTGVNCSVGTAQEVDVVGGITHMPQPLQLRKMGRCGKTVKINSYRDAWSSPFGSLLDRA